MGLINGEALKRMFNRDKSLHVDSHVKSRPYALIKDFEATSVSNVIYDPTAGGLRVLFTAILLFLAAISEEAFFNNLRLLGVKPNLVLVCLVCIATCSTERYALLMGAVTGMVVDIAYGRVFGFYGIVYMVVAFGTCMIIKDSFKAKPSYFFMYTPIYTFLVEIFVGFCARALNVYISGNLVLFENFGFTIVRRMIPESFYNATLVLILIWPITSIWLALGKNQGKDRSMFR